MIEEYKFGAIIIDGATYNHDVEVRWTGKILKWWRQEGHTVELEDLERALEANPEVIVIGTGAQGQMTVPEDVKEAIRIRGIQLIIDPTEEATKTFNVICMESEEEEGEQKRAIGLFHLTC